MPPSIRSSTAMLGIALLLMPVPAEAQLGRLGRALKRAITKTAESEGDRLLREGVRCAFDDSECISRAERDGETIVLTDSQGDPLLDEDGKPVTADAARRTQRAEGGSAAGFGGVSRSFARAFETELTGNAPEIARQRDTAMVVLSTHYGGTRQPLDGAAVHASAVHAARAYRGVEEIRRELGDAVRVAPILTAISGLQYYVFDEGHRQVIAIRGTQPDNLRNWVANLVVKGAHDTVLGLDVHEGFLLATLFALRLHHLGYDVSVTTFGSPKVTTFAAFANEPVLHRLALVRLVNEGDIVHHFPPTMDGTGKRVYAHFGREWVLGSEGECTPTNLAGSLRKSAAMVLDHDLPDWSVESHGMENYLSRVAALAEQSIVCEGETEAETHQSHEEGPCAGD